MCIRDRFQVTLGQRLETLQQGQAQEFIGEPGRVLECYGLHGGCPRQEGAVCHWQVAGSETVDRQAIMLMCLSNEAYFQVIHDVLSLQRAFFTCN